MNALIVAVISAFLGVVIVASFVDEMSNMKNDAIERGYALYCPDSGRFSWKDECK